MIGQIPAYKAAICLSKKSSIGSVTLNNSRLFFAAENCADDIKDSASALQVGISTSQLNNNDWANHFS